MYDGDNESSGKTIKLEVREWIAAQIADSSSSEGTLKVGKRSPDKSVPHANLTAPVIMREDSNTSIRTTRSTDTANEIDYELREEDENGSLNSLWIGMWYRSLAGRTLRLIQRNSQRLFLCAAPNF